MESATALTTTRQLVVPAAGALISASAARRCLSLLDPDADEFCFRTFADGPNKAGHLASSQTGTFEQIAPDLVRKNADGAGVFFVVNAGGQRACDISRVRAVFADTDGAQLDPIMRCGLDPHVVVETSPGRWHVYWLTEDLPLAQFGTVQAAIAARFGTDGSVKDLPRVMRLPGFLHQKSTPFLTRIVHESGAQPYSGRQIISAFPAPAAKTASANLLPFARPGDATPQVFTTIDTPTLVELRSALNALDAGERPVWIKAGMALHELGDVGRGLWLDWSQQSEKWKPADARKWSTFKESSSGYRAIFGYAYDVGWTSPVAALMRLHEVAAFSGVDAANEDHSASERITSAGRSAIEGGLRVVSLLDLMRAEVVPPEFVINPLVPRAHATLLGGHGGIGKSSLALSAAAHVACGVDWLGFAVRGGRALFVSLEDPGELVRYRLRNIVEHFGLDAASVSERLTILDGTACDSALAVEEHLGRAVGLIATPTFVDLEAAAKGADLIIIDNASDAYEADENNRRMVRKFVRQMLGRIARENGAGLVLLAHIDKQSAKYGAAGNSYSGSTAWHNSARSRLALLEENGEIELRQEKLNLGQQALPIALRFTERGVLVPIDGSATCAPPEDDLLAQCLLSAISRGEVISTSRGGVGNGHARTRHLPGFPTVLNDAHRFWKSVGRLELSGRLTRQRYQNENRKTKERWVIAPLHQSAPVASFA